MYTPQLYKAFALWRKSYIHVGVFNKANFIVIIILYSNHFFIAARNYETLTIILKLQYSKKILYEIFFFSMRVASTFSKLCYSLPSVFNMRNQKPTSRLLLRNVESIQAEVSFA